MNYLQEKISIEAFFEENWDATQISYENGEAPVASSEWVRLSIQNGDAFQASMGDDPAFRYIGIVYVQVFTAKDSGSGRAIQLADMAGGLFKNAVISNIVFKVPQVHKVSTPDSEWYQVNVSTEFYRGS